MRKHYVILPIILIQLIIVLMHSAEAKGENDYEYLIVTSDALKNSWNEFVGFNKRRCLRTKIQTIDYIKVNISGVDDADKLRNYIKQEYNQHNIVYVLLGGDDDNNNLNDIPHRGFRASFYDLGSNFYDDKDIAADMYFSCLDGDWKGSNQYYGEYGEEDMVWDVYAARFPVDNETELINMIHKTIKYSEQPVVNEIKNVLLSQDKFWNPDTTNPPLFPLDELIGESNANGYTTFGFTDTWIITKLYDWPNSWTAVDIRNTINERKITWINQVGHGNNSYTLKHTSDQVTNAYFTNNGTNANFFLLYTQSCFAGAFDNKTPGGTYTSDCIGEQFTAGVSNGAVAFIGNARFGSGYSNNSTDCAIQRFHRYFHDALFNKKIHYLEMMNAYSKEVNAELVTDPDILKPPYYGAMKYACYGLNILGDPALSIWTEKPQHLQVDPPGISGVDKKFIWDTKKPYTWIALLTEDGNRILCTQLTGEDGKCEIEDDVLKDYLSNNPGARLKINVKAHNHLPYHGTIGPDQVGATAFPLLKTNELYLSSNVCSIKYYLSANGLVNVSIFDSKGALVRTIINADQNAGKHTVTFRNDNLSNGIYYLRIIVNKNKSVKKLIIAK